LWLKTGSATYVRFAMTTVKKKWCSSNRPILPTFLHFSRHTVFLYCIQKDIYVHIILPESIFIGSRLQHDSF